jgi:hypothetical protein
MPFDSGVNAPGGMSYAAPILSFLQSGIGQLGNDFFEGRQQTYDDQQRQRQLRLQQPVDTSGGVDAIMRQGGQTGGLQYLQSLMPFLIDQEKRKQGQQPSPLLSGGGALGAAPATAPAPSPQATPATYQGGDAGAGTITAIATDKLGQNNPKLGAVIGNVARAAGVDPNASLTADQQGRVTRMLDNYAARTQPQGSPNARVASSFAALPEGASPPAAAPQRAPNGAAASQPLVPQVPLPFNPATPGKRFTDPQEAILALENEAARLSVNEYNAGQVTALRDWAKRIEASIQPVSVGPTSQLRDPRTGAVIAEGPAAAAYANTTAGGATLDADAQRYRQTGTLPPNMGRGIQGEAQSRAIRTRAAELEIEGGGNPADWPTRWQEYKAEGVGKSAEARVRATREANLKIILQAADAAVPAALEQSDKVWRSGFVPLNKIIQHGQVATSDPELRAFGMANLQLAEHWARAMNPTGVMRESDREKALEFLSTADSPATYKRLVQQLQTQIQRELRAVQSGKPTKEIPKPGELSTEQKAVADNSGSAKLQKWERGPDGTLRPAPEDDGKGWTTLPNGVRIREVK